MKLLFQILMFILLFNCQNAVAQVTKGKASTTSKTPSDTLSRNITIAVKKVVSLVTDSKKPASALTGSFMGIGSAQKKIFLSQVNLSGSEKTFVTKISTDRIKGIVNWQWSSVIATAPKGTMVVQLEEAKRKIDSALKKIAPLTEPDIKNHVISIGATGYFNDLNLKKDSLVLTIDYTKPLENTEQQAMDSIVFIYKTASYSKVNVSASVESFWNAYKAEDISSSRTQEAFNYLLKEVANRNIRDAFNLLIDFSSWRIDTKKARDVLTNDQRKDISDMARGVINEYNSKWDKKEPQVTTVVSTPPADLKFKLGSSFRKKDAGYTSDEYFVVYFDAVKNLYGFVTRTYVSAKKSFFKTNDNVGRYTFNYVDLSESFITNNYTPTGKVYQFCSACKGSGVTYVTQQRSTGGSWEQVNFNVYVFTPYMVTAQWEERITCGQCFGVGIKEVY